MKTLPAERDADRLRLRGAHRSSATARSGAKINGRIVPLHYRLKSGDVVEILTTKTGRGPSRDWLSLAASSRARNKIRQWFSRETREETEKKGRDALEQALKKQKPSLPQARRLRCPRPGDPRDRLQEGRGLLRRAGLRASCRSARSSTRCSQPAEDGGSRPGGGGPAQGPEGAARDRRRQISGSASRASRTCSSGWPKCCTPVPGDEIVGYISMGKGITIHRGRLLERQGSDAATRSGSRRSTGTAAPRHELPRPDRGRLLGPAAAAGGCRAHLRRARREHRRVRRPRRGSAREELVHGRGRGREGPARRC